MEVGFWASNLHGNELRSIGRLVVRRLKTGAGHCNNEFVAQVNPTQSKCDPKTILSDGASGSEFMGASEGGGGD